MQTKTCKPIVVLDGYAMNPGDLDWASLEVLGPTTIYNRTPPAQIIERAGEAEIVLTNKTVLSSEILAQLPKLRYIGVLATGYNVVDTAAARERGIVVTNVPAYASASVAQLVFAHVLNLAQHVADHGRGVSTGNWTRSKDFCYWESPQVELSGLTFGLVGFGQIGCAVAAIAQAFGMNVLVSTRTVPSNVPTGITFVELDELFRRSDVVSLHCPLTPATTHLINTERLAMMKESAFLINTGRGPLIDENALAEALNSERIAGAGLDVLSIEPPPADNPLLTAKNCCITPHFGWATYAARRRLLDVAVANVAAFLNGKPQNVVNA